MFFIHLSIFKNVIQKQYNDEIKNYNVYENVLSIMIDNDYLYYEIDKFIIKRNKKFKKCYIQN